MPEVLREMVTAAVRGRPFALAAGADHGFHFVHVSDVARAAILAARASGGTQAVYNVNGGPQVTLAEAAASVRRAVPGAQIELGPGHLHLDRQGPWDTSAAEAELGYRPLVDLDTGIREYAAWLAEHDY